MRAFVRLRLPTGEAFELGHGDLIGRLFTAALFIDDPRLSEAHAMVSLRSGALRMLGLRGRISTGRKPCSDVELAVGQTLMLAPGLELQVEEVQMPDEVMAITGPGLPRQMLAAVSSIVLEPRPAVEPRFNAQAAATIWSSGAGWSVRVGQGEAKPLAVGDTLELGDATFQAVALPLEGAGGATLFRSQMESPMRVIASFDTVHIHRGDRPVAVLDGMPARMISELVSMGGPVRWEVLAGELWGEGDSRKLRSKLDSTLSRLRSRLRQSGIRPDLVRSGGTGHLELYLHPRDEVVDRV